MATKKTTTETEEQKKCFIITPIGGESTETRVKADGLIKAVITPVLEELNIKGYAAHQIDITGSITKQIIQRIISDDIVIANLTELNPNVMYELAIRHATRKPVVIVAEHGTKLPFDIIQLNTIFYTNDMIGVDNLKPKLRNAIEAALGEEKPNNPIYDGIEDSIMREVVAKNSNDTEKYILNRLDEISKDVGALKNTKSSQTIASWPVLLTNDDISIYKEFRVLTNQSAKISAAMLKTMVKNSIQRTHPNTSSDIRISKVANDMYDIFIVFNTYIPTSDFEIAI
jgi:hypothetical protein